MKHAIIKFKKNEKGELTPNSVSDEKAYVALQKMVEPNEVVEGYFTIEVDDAKTLTQLAKVHQIIKELAVHTGHTFAEIKQEVKKRAGLYIDEPNSDRTYRSFRHCNKEDLVRAIQAAIDLGQLVGCYVD